MIRKFNVSLALMFAWSCASADITVSDVKVFSGYPWKEVMIGYTIAGNDENESFGVQVSATDRTNGKTYWSQGLVGASVANGNHLVKWNAGEEGAKFKSDNVVFKVYVARYLVIDLSGGTSAERYSTAWLLDVPDGGWTDEYKTTKVVLRYIAPGALKMQDTHDETLTRPYFMGVFEVTQKQYELVTGMNPSTFRGDTLPVETVTWNGIKNDFLTTLKNKTGFEFDLPTEAQWEYACRAGTTTSYSYGDMAKGEYMWYSENSGGVTHGVGTRPSNMWGLYDMHGNVWECCLGTFGRMYVVRGGSCSYGADSCMSSSRTGSQMQNTSVGFRLALVLANQE